MKGKGIVKDLVFSLGAAALLLLAFVGLSQSLTANWLEQFDKNVGGFIHDQRADAWTSVAKVFTFLGSGATEFILFFLIGGILIFKLKHKWETLVLFLGVLGAWVLNSALKGLFERDRPAADGWLVEVDGFSFPSGHSMVSIVFYGLITYLLWLNVYRTWKAAWFIPVIGTAIVVCIGFSRIYLGVHYPSDVLAGYMAGGIALLGCMHAVRRIRHRQAIRLNQGRDYAENGHKVSS